MTLEEIKNQVATEAFGTPWNELDTLEQEVNLWPEVYKRGVMASLDMASTNGKVIIAGFFDGIAIDKASIVNEENIVN